MAAEISRLTQVAISPEATAGTYLAPVSGEWLDNAGSDFDSHLEQVELGASAGTISATSERRISKILGSGSVVTPVGTVTSGTILGAVFGQYDASPTGAGPYTHDYTVLNSNQHKTFSVVLQDGNRTQDVYTRQVLDTLEVSAEMGGEFVLFNMGFIGTGASSESTATPAYATQDFFTPDQITVELAANSGALTGTGNTCVESLTLNVSKNAITKGCLGSTDITKSYNQQMMVDGSITVEYDGTSEWDEHFAGTTKAMNIIFTSGTNVMTFTLGEISLGDPTLSKDLDGIQTLERPFQVNLPTTNFTASLVNGTALYPLT